MSEVPCTGLRVLDLSQGLAGPYCAMMLAQHGADVVKLEPPGGDWSRQVNPVGGDRTASFITCNRGKRSIVVDLKERAGLDIALKLAARADVIVENNRAGISERLGIGYEQIKTLNPNVIYVSITGYGQNGPYRDRAVTDSLMQAGSGFMTNNLDKTGTPQRLDFFVPDYTTGLMALQATSMALLGRERGQGGRHLDISLMRTMLAFQQHVILTKTFIDGPIPPAFPPTGIFATADGQMAISILREKFFVGLCRALELDRLIGDPRFASKDGRVANEIALNAELDAAFARWTTAEIESRFVKADVPHQRVLTHAEAVADVEIGTAGTVARTVYPDLGVLPLINVPGTVRLGEGDSRAMAPELGADTAVVLSDIGFTDEAVTGLRAKGIVA